MQTIYLDPADATNAIMRRAFPNYNGKMFKLTIHSQAGMDLSSYWSGGSRDYFQIVQLGTDNAMEVPQNGTPYDGYDLSASQVPCNGWAVVRHTISCGQDSGLTLHLHADNAARYLPAPLTLTLDERIVLEYTASLKASYNGRTRLDEARTDHGMTQPRWDAARETLTAQKLLTKAGAITPAGRNARSTMEKLPPTLSQQRHDAAYRQYLIAEGRA